MKELLKQLGTSFKVVELDIESKSKQTLCIFQTACLLFFFVAFEIFDVVNEEIFLSLSLIMLTVWLCMLNE